MTKKNSANKKISFEIPERLRDTRLKFLPIPARAKAPILKDWPNRGVPHDNPELLAHLAAGGNLAVLTGKASGGLLIVDIDKLEVVDEIIAQLPATFTVRTGSGGAHLYFLVDNSKGTRFHSGDLKGDRGCVVAPGSTHPNGTRYEVIVDKPIATTTRNEINTLLGGENKQTRRRAPVQSGALRQALTDGGVAVTGDKIICPFHHDKVPSLHIYDDHAFCFGCSKRVSDTELVKKLVGGTRSEAAAKLGKPDRIVEFLALRERIFEAYAIADRDERRRETAKIPGWIAQHILDHEKIWTLRYDREPPMYFYDDKSGLCLPEGRTFVRRTCKQLMGKAFRESIVKLTIEQLIPSSYVEPNEFFAESEPKLLPTRDGVLNLETRELVPFDRSMKFFTKIPWRYDPAAKCPKFETFLREVLESNDDILRIQELLGAMLWRGRLLHKFFVFTGSGRNGKGAISTIIREFLGAKNVSTADIHALSSHRFLLAELHGKMLTISEETSSRDLKNTAVLKTLCGGDKVTAEKKFGHPFSFTPFAELVICCNSLPRFQDDSDALWARLEVIKFPFQFLPQRDLGAAQARGDTNIKLQKPARVQEIITDAEEMAGILNFSLEGLNRLKANGEYTGSATMSEIRKWYLENSDPFFVFAQEMIESGGAEDYIPRHTLIKAFDKWRTVRGVFKNSTDGAIKKCLQDEWGVDDRKVRLPDGKGRERRLYGIRWAGEILHKCWKCDQTPCIDWDQEKKPVCVACHLEVTEEKVR